MFGRNKQKRRRDRAGTLRQVKPPLFRRLIYWAAVAGLWGGIGVAVFVGVCAMTLPTPTDIRAGWNAPAIIMAARDGSTLYTVGRRRGEWLERATLPQTLINAVVATEDRRFYSHGPMDLRGIARAFAVNIKAGSIVEGGSTLTQQLAKNLFLTPERTITRKVQEVLLAFWLEDKYSKDDILTFYLNRVYFGGGAYGVDAAAHLYFGHGARRLDLSESALLAGLLKAPSRYNPHRSATGAWDRAGVVLGTMVATDHISQAQATAARLPTIVPKSHPGDARYFIDWIQTTLDGILGEPTDDIFVRTTLDPVMQRAAEEAVANALSTQGQTADVEQAALLALSPDGAVRAMVGGRDYNTSQFNRAVQAKRQTGSAFKLFVYLTAFESGLTPSTEMRDSPITLDGWSPGNYSGTHRGEMTLEYAFANSINTVAVKLSERVNRDQVREMAKRLGVTSALTPHPSLALGASEMTVKELTAAYAAVANGGHAVTPYGILEVRTASGQQLYVGVPEQKPAVLSEDAVTHMRRLLTVALNSGTGKAARIDRPAAGKTGTSQDYRDAWFMGFTADLVTGVWMGNDDNHPTHRVVGGGLPARIWQDFMLKAHQGRPQRRLADVPAPEPAPPAKPERQGFFQRLFGN